MLKKSQERILSTNSFECPQASSNLRIKDTQEFLYKTITTLKTNRMDYHICQSLYLYRIKFIMDKNKKKKNERKSTIFDWNYLYNEDIEQIFTRILKLFEVDGQIIILSLFLLEKFIYKSRIILDENNYTKLIIVSLMETIKFFVDDSSIDAKLICSVLKIDKEMLVNMEYTFLNSINYKLNIDEEKFFLYKQKIMIIWVDYLKNKLWKKV